MAATGTVSRSALHDHQALLRELARTVVAAIEPAEQFGTILEDRCERYPVRTRIAAQIVCTYIERGPLGYADTCRAIGRGRKDGTTRNAMRAALAAGLVARDEQERVYGLPTQIADVDRRRAEAQRRREHIDRLSELRVNRDAPPPGLPAPACRCGGQSIRTEHGGAVCLQCGLRTEAAA